MVRRKLNIKRIEDKAKRHVAFTKRRNGLFKRANELCRNCDAQIAIITISLSGNIYAWGHPTVDSVLKRYEACTAQKPDDETKQTPETPPDDHHHQNKPDMGLALSLSLPADEKEDTSKCSEKNKADHDKGLLSKTQMMMASLDLSKVDDIQMDELAKLKSLR